MEWYKSIEFWIGTLVTLAFFQMFFDKTFGAMLFVLRSFKNLVIK